MTRWWLMPLLAGTLAACTPLQTRLPGDDLEQRWQAHVRSLSGKSDWLVRGRVALRSADEGWSAALVWKQLGGRFDIRLIGPLGRGRLAIQGDEHAASLRTSEGAAYSASDASALLRDHLGISMPVTGLRFWVMGLPRPGAAYERVLDAEGRLESLVQDGWSIRFQRYEWFSNLALPSVIQLSNPPYRVKLLVKNRTFLESLDVDWLPEEGDAGARVVLF